MRASRKSMPPGTSACHRADSELPEQYGEVLDIVRPASLRGAVVAIEHADLEGQVQLRIDEHFHGDLAFDAIFAEVPEVGKVLGGAAQLAARAEAMLDVGARQAFPHDRIVGAAELA